MKVAAAIIGCVLSISACGRTPPLTDLEKKQVSEMTTDMKTHCVGRYLIDMPAVVTPLGTAKFGEVTVQAQAMTSDQFDDAVKEREAKMKATKSSMGYRFLYGYGEVPGVKRTQYFVSLGDYGSSSDAVRIINAYRWDQGYQLTMTLEATDFSHSKMRDDPSVALMAVQNDLPQKTQIVFDLIARLQGRPNDVIPTEPGACFFGGFLNGKASGEEEIDSSFLIPDKRDAWFNLESFTTLNAEDTLLRRVHSSDMGELFKVTHGRLIRSGTITLEGGMKADEALMSGRTPAHDNIQGNLLTLEANYAGGPVTPYLVLDMMNGYPSVLITTREIKHASLTEGEAIGIWDKVSRSLRARPDAF
jgi:Tle cognate immunity protein 4 C-terminal domain/Tle cognate immunity protein 4 N-terminal domain